MLNLQPTTHDRRLNIIIVCAVGCLLWVVGQSAYAATAVLEVDTGTETINAIEGTLVLPSGISVSDIYTGNSAVLIWISAPALDAEGDKIHFSGITPGGFRGKYPVFSIMGEFNESALSLFRFTGITALRNDGSGTAVRVRLSLAATNLEEDTAPPEPFEPSISSSADLFEGRYFASFVAQDKGLGIEKYEYSSTWLFPPSERSWREVSSPHVLSRADTFKTLHIRAIDKAGNYRGVSTAGPYRYASILFGIIIIMSCALLFGRPSYFSRS